MSTTRVYLGRLPYGTRERDIDKFLRGYGKIRDINLKNGYGFVEFDDYRDADDAVRDLNGKELLGERIQVEHSRGTERGYSSGSRRGGRGFGRDRGGGADKSKRYGPPIRTPWRIIVENLSTRVSWQDLKDFVRQSGEVTYGDAHKQRQGEGIVEFATYDDMKSAIRKLDGYELNGRRIKLIDDSPRKRSRSYSRSRSRSHSRSRSRSAKKGRSRSRSHSRHRSSSRKSRSASRSRSHSGSRSRSRSRSPRKSRSKSPHKSRSRSPRKSRSRSPRKSHSRSASRSRSRSKSHSKSKSPAKKEGSKSPARSKSKSKSPEKEKTPEPEQNGTE